MSISHVPSSQIVAVDLARHELTLRREIPSATGGNHRRQARLYCRVTLRDGTVGYGEAAPHPTRGPTIAAIESVSRAAVQSLGDPAALPQLVQTAILDAAARQAQVPLWRYLGIPAPPAECRTLLTFGGTSPERVCEEIERAQPAGIKLKLLGGASDLDVVHAVAQAYAAPLALDINGAWSMEEAAGKLRALETLGSRLLWVEQPCPPEEMLRRLPTGLRIVADEALEHPGADLRLYDGVLLKPARVGIHRCVQLAQQARDCGQFVTFGCHLQSAVLSNATLLLSGLMLSEWMDLDTVLLAGDDPFAPPGASATTERIVVPLGSGLCTEPVIELPWTPVFRRA